MAPLDDSKGVWKSGKGKGRKTPKGRQLFHTEIPTAAFDFIEWMRARHRRHTDERLRATAPPPHHAAPARARFATAIENGTATEQSQNTMSDGPDPTPRDTAGNADDDWLTSPTHRSLVKRAHETSKTSNELALSPGPSIAKRLQQRNDYADNDVIKFPPIAPSDAHVPESTAARRMRLRPEDFKKYDYTKVCPGCVSLKSGTSVRARRNHTQACRDRMEEAIGEVLWKANRKAGPSRPTYII